MKFKETNQICSPLKISQSINAESACDRNNKSMYHSFMKARKRGETKEDSENVFF